MKLSGCIQRLFMTYALSVKSANHPNRQSFQRMFCDSSGPFSRHGLGRIVSCHANGLARCGQGNPDEEFGFSLPDSSIVGSEPARGREAARVGNAASRPRVNPLRALRARISRIPVAALAERGECRLCRCHGFVVLFALTYCISFYFCDGMYRHCIIRLR